MTDIDRKRLRELCEKARALSGKTFAFGSRCTRTEAEFLDIGISAVPAILDEVDDLEERIAGLERQLAEARAALGPFANAANHIPDWMPDECWTSCNSYRVKKSFAPHPSWAGVEGDIQLALWIGGMPLSVFRRARAILAAAEALEKKEIG